MSFRTAGGSLPVLRDVSFAVDRGETLAVVGESGCGKTVAALALLGLLPGNAEVSGKILWRDQDLLPLSAEEWRRYRGKRMGMVFQEPATSLNPVYSVGEQVAEALRFHQGLSRQDAWDRAVDLLAEVHLPDAAARARDYPHQLSGGMRQRVMLAASLASEPELLLADEPTTALDVTVQAQVIDLLVKLQRRRNMAMIFITHDLALVPALADRLAVLYAGSLVESGPVTRVLARPAHPYTRALVETLPEFWPVDGRLPDLPGLPPDPSHLPPGCPFGPRCAHARPECQARMPAILSVGEEREVACLPGVAHELGAKEVLP